MGLPASRVEEPARLGIRDVLAGAFAQADDQIGYTNVHFAEGAISKPLCVKGVFSGALVGAGVTGRGVGLGVVRGD